MRAIGVTILAAFLAGPGVRAHCFLSCADVDRAAAPTSCHDDTADGPGLAPAHACAETALLLVPAVKRAVGQAPIVGAVLAPLFIALTRANPVGPAPAHPVHAASPPVAPFLIPLRI